MLDSTTTLMLNHAFRMGCGGITIRNLFVKLNDFNLKKAQLDDEETVSAENQKRLSCECNHPAPHGAGWLQGGIQKNGDVYMVFLDKISYIRHITNVACR